ncbi:MAG: hypothetical protein J4F32_06960 [Dehalococcoidia bacterium]|nr:hypothetical protein [Dehalococcoidia bacterium]
MLYIALLTAMTWRDSRRVGWSASAETRAKAITALAAAVRRSNRPAFRAAESRWGAIEVSLGRGGVGMS